MNDLERYLAAVEIYNREMDKRGTWRYRVALFLANIWSKIWGGVALLVATSSLALGLCAVEIPDAIIRALVHVESGARWVDTGDIVGGWKRGNAGEISHFQLSGAAIHDMGAAKKTSRIASDPVLAESLARLWLSRCYERAGNWPDALSRYNAGSRYRERAARDYAARIIALSSL